MDLDDEDSLFVTDSEVIEVGLSSSPPRPSNSAAATGGSQQQRGLIPPEHLPGAIDLSGEGTPLDFQTPNTRRPHHHHHHHHHHRHTQPRRHHHHHHHHHHPRPRQLVRAVIDLTGESTSALSEVDASLQMQTSQIGRNPRRTMSQRVTPPSLSRSDGTLSRPTAPADVIDLTGDSPEHDTSLLSHSLRPRQQPYNPNRRALHGYHGSADSLFSVGFGASGSQFTDMRGIRQTLAGLFNSDIISFGFNRPTYTPPRPEPERQSPKPPMEPTLPTREGFTRNTCAEPAEDLVVVCPCCDEELAYDASGNNAPAKDKKRKRAVGEHHYWALKKCGHVYCSECFENRRPTKTHPDGVGFPAPDGKVPYHAINELRCAVEGCDTKIAQKGEWVGIFA
ncbi:RING finger domain protein [Geosmithia morbida]|uniref:RING finger domain protein n=1 Tax=Geosmithia morbida TaxID=1094350 RepID=A0A9P4YQE8_9HYPO|nr:RING finger domain protein [Geosmithia morbida]KAF4119818.1 RING finger domain protein [Geosmithia morbida]